MKQMGSRVPGHVLGPLLLSYRQRNSGRVLEIEAIFKFQEGPVVA